MTTAWPEPVERVARFLRESGIDLKAIKERLGHGSLETTDIYLGAMERIKAGNWQKLQQLELGGFDAPPAKDAKKEKRSGIPAFAGMTKVDRE